jgi:radical SAM superfamily enzyme YgiQ (UPF0313 family)
MNEPADILLATINAKWIHPSLALRLLKANLGSLEGRCEILEFALRQPLREKLEPIIAARPRILGLSVSIWNHSATLELLKELRFPAASESCPRPLVVLGGPEVSWLRPEAEIFRYADYVIRGEGEDAFRTLCEDLLRGKPPNARESGRKDPAANPERRALHLVSKPVDLNAVDPGYRLYTAEDLGRKLVYVEASRGCAFRCDFCLSAAGSADGARNPRPVREFPLEPFLSNLDDLAARGARTFKFLDRSFNLDIERARRIMEFFLDRIDAEKRKRTEESGRPADRPLCVHFEMVPSRFPPELRETLRRFPRGSLRLEVGIQTLNSAVSARIGRPGNPEKELELLSFLRRETGALVHADLIAGLPGEDFASFARGFDRLWAALTAEPRPIPRGPKKNFQPPEIQLGILKLLPGAPLARHTESFGMRYNPAPPYEVIETAALPAAALDRIKNFARFWELIVNRNAFPGITAALVPPGEPAFDRFMALADRLLAHFGRNWGIDREDLKQALGEAPGSRIVE